MHDFDPIHEGYFRIYQALDKYTESPNKILITSKTGHETVVLRSSLNEQKKEYIGLSNEVSCWEILARLTIRGLGASLLPDYIEWNYKDSLRPCKPLQDIKIPYELGLVYRSSPENLGRFQAFKEVFKESFEQSSLKD